MSDGIPVVVVIAIFTDEHSTVDGDLLVRCSAFHWGSCNYGGNAKGKTSEDLGTHFGFNKRWVGLCRKIEDGETSETSVGTILTKQVANVKCDHVPNSNA